MRLEIDQIYGTTSNAKQGLCAEGNSLAYIASGGALVCDINGTSISKQRFFCANQTEAHRNESDSYLTRFEAMSLADQPSKDELGFPKDNNPEVVFRADPSAEGTSSPSKLRNKMRNTTCLAISPNKRLFAMGEVGYRPRILIYSLASDSSASPLYIIEEHTFGVCHLCFSPDSSKLCSLGSANDGFLYIWDLRLDQRKRLLGSAKCITTMNDLLWHGNHVIALGQRSIKVWRIDEDMLVEGKTASLKSRNAILKQYVNSNFKEGRLLDSHRLLVLSGASDTFLLDLQEDLILKHIATAPFTLCSILVSGRDLLLIGEKFGSQEVKAFFENPHACFEKCVSAQLDSAPVTSSLLEDSVVVLTESKQIYFTEKCLQNSSQLNTGISNDVAQVKKTWNGKMHLLSRAGLVQELADGKIVSVAWFESSPMRDLESSFCCFDLSGEHLFLGDSKGVLVICHTQEKGPLHVQKRIKLHSSSISDVAFFQTNGMHFAVTIGRDRMVQVLQKSESGEWSIFQTIGVHKGALIKVIISQEKIYVCSADRSISVHTIQVSDGVPVISMERIISLKSTPVTFDISDKFVIVSTANKEVMVHHNSASFTLSCTLKLKTNQQDAVTVEHLVAANNMLFAACSDKSIQVWSITKCQLLATGWGHAESIVGLAVLEEDLICSLGYDGCLFTWRVKDQESPLKTEPERVICDSALSQRPVRKFAPSPLKKGSPVKKEKDEVETSPLKMRERLTPLKQRTLFGDPKPSPNSSPLSHRMVVRKSPEPSGRTRLASSKFSFEVLIQQLRLLQRAQDLTSKEKEMIALELRNAAHHLGEDLSDHKQQELLSHYSEQLVEMIKTKLQTGDQGGSS